MNLAAVDIAGTIPYLISVDAGRAVLQLPTVEVGRAIPRRRDGASRWPLRNLAAVDVTQRIAIQVLGADAIAQCRPRLRALILTPAKILTSAALANRVLQAIARRGIPVGDAPPVAGIVVPVHVPVIGRDAVVDIDVVPLIDVDVDVTAPPVDTAP